MSYHSHSPFLEPSEVYYKRKRSSSGRSDKSVAELTVDLHEAILNVDAKAVKRFVSDGANPNLPLEECAYKDKNDELVTFNKRLAIIQRVCSSERVVLFKDNKAILNAINLAIIVCYSLDCFISQFGPKHDEEYRCKRLEGSIAIDEILHYLIHHEKTNFGHNGNDCDDEDDDTFFSLKTPADIAKKLAADYECIFPENIRQNSLAKLLRELSFENERNERKKWTTLRRDTRFADVTFQCPDGEVLAHKCVLVANVEYFDKAFSQSWKQAMSGVWKMDEPKNLVEALVKYIYAGSVSRQILKDHAHQLLLMSCEYRMTRLQETCKDWLISRLSISNVCDLLHSAHLHGFVDAKEACFHFLKKNSDTALGEQDIAQFAVDNPELWEEVRDYMKSPGQKRKR